MFLTPFIDFGEPIEKFIGVVSEKNIDEISKENPEKGSTNVKGTKELGVVSNRARIIGTSDKIRIATVTEKGTTLQGCGIAIGSGPLDQSKSYFEIHVEEDETVVNVGALGKNPNMVLSEAWQVLSRIPNTIHVPLGRFSKGDIIGVLIDISDFPPKVSAYKSDEKPIQSASNSARGDLWPSIELVNGSITVVFNREHLHGLSPERLSRGIEAVMIRTNFERLKNLREMNVNGERIGKGWFLKTAKHLNNWLIDPFHLFRSGDHLIARRPNQRLLILKERDYFLESLKVSDLRPFTHEQFSAVVSSTMGIELEDTVTLADARCFDIEFETGGETKKMIVFGKYLDSVRNLHRIMTTPPDTSLEGGAEIHIDDLLCPLSREKTLKSSNTDSTTMASSYSFGIDRFLLTSSNLSN